MKSIIRNRITKRIVIGLMVLFILPPLVSSCLQFRMTPLEVDEYFKSNKNLQPKLLKVEIDKRNIHYAYQHNHQNITAVFVHGAPGSWSAFIDFMMNDDLRESVNILSIDRPGYGFSGFGDPETILENQAYFLAGVLQQFPGHQFILIGHSLGGPVIARLAMDYPELADALVLVAPSIDPNLEKDEWYRYLGKNRLVKWIIPTSLWVTNEEIWYLKEELQLMVPLWKDISIPTIVIQGTNDRLVPKENADFAKNVISNELLEVRLLEGVNHFIPWNHPDEIVDAVLRIVQQLK